MELKCWANLAVMFFLMLFSGLTAETWNDSRKTLMLQDLDVIKHHIEVGYAPAAWKKEHLGWDLTQSYNEARKQILTTPHLSVKEFQQILRKFINTMKDYHADIVFFSSESASLPFTIKGVDNRYFIDWLDPLRLPPSHYALKVGDELLEFDQKPIACIIDDLKQKCSKSSYALTDQRVAETKLTLRTGMSGDSVPKGAILIKTCSALTGRTNVCQLHWAYLPEQITNPGDSVNVLNCISSPKANSLFQNVSFPQIKMASPLHAAYAEKFADRNGNVGSKKSFIPPLGEITWQKEDPNSKKKKSSSDSFNWHAYIYEHPSGASIGYIRVPHYMGSKADAEEFGELINYMEEETKALVIDQLHNFGGLVSFQYQLASMLSTEPLKTPKHRIKITQKEVLAAHEMLEEIKLMDLMLSLREEEGDEHEQSDAEESSAHERGVNFQKLLFLKDYSELILEDWQKGHPLSRPTPILGVDRINPHPKYNYSKPILMLIDEMDFSGGDFMPAILQDNQRALLFGNRTAGAGGYVYFFQFPNINGIGTCSYTASIAERINLEKIEDLGVQPEIEYRLTVSDLQNNYKGYVQAVNEAMQTLLDPSKALPSKE